MPRQTSARIYSGEFKVATVKRIVAGERVRTLAKELAIKPQVLYRWWSTFEREGAEALSRPPGRPPGTAAAPAPPPPAPRRRRATRRTAKPLSAEAARIVELEQKVDEQTRKIGEQALEIDFFGRALRHIAAARPSRGGRGARPSSP
jgi:transposase-like protein